MENFGENVELTTQENNYLTELKTLEGNSEVGEIMYYKQIHDRPEFNKEQKEVVVEAQFMILQELLKRQPKHIFLESLIGNYSSKDFVSQAPMIKGVVDMFFDGLELKSFKGLSEIQKEVLTDLGAARIYVYLKDGITLHGNYKDQEESDSIDKQIDISDGLDDREMEIIFNEREEMMTSNISDFLTNNPGEKVSMIYGLAHDFSDNISEKFGNNKPSLTELSVPKDLERMLELSTLRINNEITNESDTTYSNEDYYYEQNQKRRIEVLKSFEDGEELYAGDFEYLPDLETKQEVLKSGKIGVFHDFNEDLELSPMKREKTRAFLIENMQPLSKESERIIEEYLDKKYSLLEK